MDKVRKVMHEFASGVLHSGSPSGPAVTSRRQALAIALAEQAKQHGGGGAPPAPAATRRATAKRKA